MLMSRNLVLRPILTWNGLRPSTTSKLWMGRGMTFTTATNPTRTKMVFWSPLSHLSTPVVNSTLVSSSSASLSSFHASSIRSFATKSSSLSKVLNRELQEEKEIESSEMPDFLVELQSKIQKDWSIMDDPDSGNVKMVKKTNLPNGSKLILLFHCQDSVDDDPEADDYHEESEDDPDEPSSSVRFIATLSKAGNTMVMNCLASGTTISIESVATTKEDVDSILNRGKVADKAYQGPEMFELAEDLQESFETYLKDDCGIGPDVSSFIAMYSDFKEQTEYFKWIAMAKSIVS
jgi:Mitochondrial glycoprotein